MTMRSSTYRVEEAKYSTMHMDLRPVPEEFRVHHNGDYSGDVKITLTAEQMRDRIDSDDPSDPYAIAHIDLPYKLLEQIVMGKLQQDLVSKIEEMDLDTFKKYVQEVL
jgi:hypothetical protein